MTIIEYIVRFLKRVLPKSNQALLLDNINDLKNDPDAYGRVADMYLKLHTIHATLIGRSGDDNWNFFISKMYNELYHTYREMYFEHLNLSNNE